MITKIFDREKRRGSWTWISPRPAPAARSSALRPDAAIAAETRTDASPTRSDPSGPVLPPGRSASAR